MRKFIFVTAAILIMLNTGLAGCGFELAAGMVKELEDNQDGIRQELGELWDAFLKEASEWSESLNRENREE